MLWKWSMVAADTVTGIGTLSEAAARARLCSSMPYSFLMSSAWMGRRHSRPSLSGTAMTRGLAKSRWSEPLRRDVARRAASSRAASRARVSCGPAAAGGTLAARMSRSALWSESWVLRHSGSATRLEPVSDLPPCAAIAAGAGLVAETFLTPRTGSEEEVGGSLSAMAADSYLADVVPTRRDWRKYMKKRKNEATSRPACTAEETTRPRTKSSHLAPPQPKTHEQWPLSQWPLPEQISASWPVRQEMTSRFFMCAPKILRLDTMSGPKL
mmetsp:Transcript_23038/g.65422  ORF Transcript_23038/g.65422 Transcript_23038/m.65422 type:complete len:269 (+) Transcript_23038:1444-2250(+)